MSMFKMKRGVNFTVSRSIWKKDRTYIGFFFFYKIDGLLKQIMVMIINDLQTITYGFMNLFDFNLFSLAFTSIRYNYCITY